VPTGEHSTAVTATPPVAPASKPLSLDADSPRSTASSALMTPQ